MKLKHLFAVVIALSSGSALAQNSKVITAFNYLKYDELDKAKTAIDEAVVAEKTNISPKAWFYRGQIYTKIAASEKFKSLDPNAAQVAIESYFKSLELDPKSEYAEDILPALKTAKYAAFNAGVGALNAKNYAASAQSFETVLKVDDALHVLPSDTLHLNAMFYKGYSQEMSSDLAGAKETYVKLIDNKYFDPKVYFQLANLYKTQKDTSKAIAVIQMGRKSFPEDVNLLNEETNYILSKGNPTDAIKNINLAIEKEPKNASLYLALGSIYDKQGNGAKAMELYKKSIEIDPKSFDSHFNIGVSLFNQGAQIVNDAKDIKDNAKYDAETKKAEAKFKEAIPFFEKAHEINPKDLQTLNSLKQLYLRVGDTANYNSAKAKIDALKK